MSLNNPQRRPWGTARGAHIIMTISWAAAALTALVAAAFWVRSLQDGDDAFAVSLIAFNVSIFICLGALAVDLITLPRRNVEDASALVHFPGSWFTGAGIGALVASAFGPPDVAALIWGAVMLIGGVVIYISPQLLATSRAKRALHNRRVQSTGARAIATVTEVHTFYRQHVPHQRATLQFTDQDGNERWFTQTAPVGAERVATGQRLTLHYDATRPGHRRSLMVDWPKGWP